MNAHTHSHSPVDTCLALYLVSQLMPTIHGLTTQATPTADPLSLLVHREKLSDSPVVNNLPTDERDVFDACLDHVVTLSVSQRVSLAGTHLGHLSVREMHLIHHDVLRTRGSRSPSGYFQLVLWTFNHLNAA